jgi:biopolymer transport protein ExbB
MSDSVSQLIVKGTFALLIAFSAITWALVFVKAVQQARTRRRSEEVEERIRRAGLALWTEAADEPVEVRRDLLERGLRQQVQKERRALEGGLSLLASIGTTSPFVGLFGTVWGIIHALRRITGAGSASLDVVAGPIGEALVATGIGIAVAVPAVLAYNYFVRSLKSATAEWEDFADRVVIRAVSGSEARSPSSQKQVARDEGFTALEASV